MDANPDTKGISGQAWISGLQACRDPVEKHVEKNRVE
jgi:hypothetical protein